MYENYYVSNYSHEYLTSKGFKFKKSTCADEPDAYTYRFTLYKYRNRMNLLECTITVSAEDGHVSLIVTQQNGSIYAPFYDTNHYGDFSEILNVINSKIKKEFTKLNIVEKN